MTPTKVTVKVSITPEEWKELKERCGTYSPPTRRTVMLGWLYDRWFEVKYWPIHFRLWFGATKYRIKDFILGRNLGE